MRKHFTAIEARFPPNTPTQNRPPDSRLLSNANSARPYHRRHHRLARIYCYQSSRNQDFNFSRFARTAHFYSQAWRTLVRIFRADRIFTNWALSPVPFGVNCETVAHSIFGRTSWNGTHFHILIGMLILLQYHRKRRFKYRPNAQLGIQQGEYRIWALLVLIFWVAMSCGFAGIQGFGGTYCFQPKTWNQPWRWRQYVPPKRCYLPTSPHTHTHTHTHRYDPEYKYRPVRASNISKRCFYSILGTLVLHSDRRLFSSAIQGV
jgi:hypothetical protein